MKYISLRRYVQYSIVLLALIAALLACGSQGRQRTPQLDYQLVGELPHDPHSYIQGAEIVGDLLYESAGGYRKSRLFVTDLRTREVQQQRKLSDALFAEGLTLIDDTLFLLTWKERKLLTFDRQSLTLQSEWDIDGEGWGLAYDGRSLLKTDGSARLSYLSPQDLALQRTVTVRSDGRPLPSLNELEYVNGWLLANIWYQDRVALICPGSGEVAAWLDLRRLAAKHKRQGVLNGLAYWHNEEVLLISGKNWDRAYLIRVQLPDLAQSC